MIPFSHKPVLLNECLEGLKIDPKGTYLDCTVGGGGHSFEIASRLNGGNLYCFDKDDEALAAADERLRQFDYVKLIKGDFRDADSLLKPYTCGIDGALLDLGVSSHQLDDPERGFSYLNDGALDMRMSSEGETAADIVNTYDIEDLTKILREYGEEPYAYQIAKKIVNSRETRDIMTTLQLSEIVTSALPPAIRRKEKHPARRTFQALRIAVNDELGALTQGLNAVFDLLNPGGRLCVITFHSLEDRIVKNFYKDKSQGCTCPPEFPVCVCGKVPLADIITKKPVTADAEELEINRRSRSAKLRVLQKR